MGKWVLKLAIGACVIAGMAWPDPALAQRSLLLPLSQAFDNAYRSGHYKEALEISKKAEALATKQVLKKGERAYLLANKAEVLRCLGQYNEAEETFKAALQSAEAEPCTLTKNSVIPGVYLDLPIIYETEGRYPEAEGMWLSCYQLTGRNANFGFYPIDHLAMLYIRWGKLDKALPYLEKGQAMALKAPKTLGLPYSQLVTAVYLKNKGKYKESEQKFVESLKSCAEQVGQQHAYYGKILLEQSELFREESRYADAENSLNEALKITQATYTGDHPDTADIMVHLAMVLSEEGRYKEGRDLLDKALKMDENVYGSGDNLFISKARQCLGNILRQDGLYKEAQEKIAQALATQQKIIGNDNIDVAVTMRDLALVQMEMGNFNEAETLLKDSLAIVNHQTGPDHPQRIEATNALAHCYLTERKYSDAEPLLKDVLAQSERVLGEKHAATASSAHDLGELYSKQKQYEEAEKYLQKALSIDEDLYGPKTPQVAADLMTLATVYGYDGKGKLGEPLLARAAEIKNVLPGGGIAADITTPVNTTNDRPVTDKWALVIGISNFKDPSINLKYAAKDATDFKNFLVNSEKFRPDHVKLLTDESATHENIIDMMGEKWLGRHVRPDDLVVVYVSSHGSRYEEEGVNFLVTYDTNKNALSSKGIPMQWLSKTIRDEVHSNRVILILDVCHSGSATEGAKALVHTTDAGFDAKQAAFGSGWMIICSSAKEQVSWESKDYENSVFTRRLIEALQTRQDKTTLLEAYKQLKVMVESEVLRDRGDLQTPVLLNKGWTGKDPELAVETAGGKQATK
jgi:tetratricopeptide (TPR) repeat protein